MAHLKAQAQGDADEGTQEKSTIGAPAIWVPNWGWDKNGDRNHWG
jgi:hypothetical protein